VATEPRAADDSALRVLGLAQELGVRVDPEEAPWMAAALEQQRDIEQLILELDLDDVDPITVFDPRWEG
jgi:ribosomal protein L12E/L44/L45/RPP1/RPP2